MTAINVYFVRHGQTYLNLYNRLQGWSDAPLTAKGIADAKRAGEQLKTIKFDQAYSSDLTRAVNTAKMILTANPTEINEPIQNPDFREEFFGYFEGADGPHTWDFIGRPQGISDFSQMIAAFSMEKVRDMIAAADPYNDAEDDATFWKRLDNGFEMLGKQPAGANILVTSHGTTIRSIVSRYGNKEDANQSPKNGSITKLSLDNGDITVDFYNQIELPK